MVRKRVPRFSRKEYLEFNRFYKKDKSEKWLNSYNKWLIVSKGIEINVADRINSLKRKNASSASKSKKNSK